MKIMDYSLLLGIHYKRRATEPGKAPTTHDSARAHAGWGSHTQPFCHNRAEGEVGQADT